MNKVLITLILVVSVACTSLAMGNLPPRKDFQADKGQNRFISSNGGNVVSIGGGHNGLSLSDIIALAGMVGLGALWAHQKFGPGSNPTDLHSEVGNSIGDFRKDETSVAEL